MRSFPIGHRLITDESPCYVIAEAGHNHGGNLETALTMITTAAACGASAVKLQKRHNETLYSPAMLAKPYENENSYGTTYGDHRAALEFNHRQYGACQEQAHISLVDFFATAFDEPSADFLADLHVPAIKIHSGGLTDTPLLTHVARLGIPIILSTGGGSERDIDQAVQRITAQTPHLAVLHCTATYPVQDFSQLNLRCIMTLRSRYPDLIIGWSGHDSGIAMALIAYAFGARIIEKHFTLNRASKGTDHGFSIEPAGLKKLCRDLERAHLALGDGVKRIYETEFGPLSKMRRWLVNGKWQIGTDVEQTPKIHA